MYIFNNCRIDYLKRIHPNNNRLSRASGALVNQILGGIRILNVVHPEINFNLLSGLESGKAWIQQLISR
jgi:hypothetical protein